MRQRSTQFKKIILLCGGMLAFLMARCPLAGALLVQQTKLTVDIGYAPVLFGKSVAVSGDTAVIGLTGGVNNTGGAFIFTRQPDGTWVQSAKLFPSDSLAKDYFGISVAIDGDTVVIGASGKNNYKGAAYVFAKPPGGWQDMTQTAKLTASDGQEGDYFGWSVAVSGNTVIAGAYADDILSKSGQYLVIKKTGDLPMCLSNREATGQNDRERKTDRLRRSRGRFFRLVCGSERRYHRGRRSV